MMAAKSGRTHFMFPCPPPPFKFLDPLLERFEPCRGDLFLDLVLNRKQLLMKVRYDFRVNSHEHTYDGWEYLVIHLVAPYIQKYLNEPPK